MKRRCSVTIVMTMLIAIIMSFQQPVMAQADNDIARIDLTFSEDAKGQIQANPGGTGYAVVDVSYEKPAQTGNVQVKATVVPMVGYTMNNLTFENVYVNGAEKKALFKDSIGRWVVDVSFNVKSTFNVSWSEKHPGKVTWDKVDGATNYLVEVFCYGRFGEERKLHTVATSRTIDLCDFIYEDYMGVNMYVRVTARDRYRNEIQTGETCAFEDMEFEISNSFWKSFDRYYDKFFEVTGWNWWDGLADNWVYFLYYYERNHADETYDYPTSSTTPGTTGDLGWKQVGSVWYYYDTPGHMKTNGWLYDAGYWYYLQPDGKMRTGWLSLGDAKYFLKVSGQHPEGSMINGWEKINGLWYYFYPANSPYNGQMAKNYWAPSGNDWYYIGSDGVMITGWTVYNGRSIYIDSNSGTYQWTTSRPY